MKSISIIGAGVTGVSLGIYAQKHGFKTDIYEMHSLPGGLCTSWRRGDYLIDGSVHWFLGSNKGSPLYPLLEELNIIGNVEFISHDIFRVVQVKEHRLTIYTDIDRLEKELIRIAPEDEKQIRVFTGLVRRFTKFSPPLDKDFGNYSLSDIIKMLPFMPAFLRYKSMTIDDFCRRFKSPLLREMFFYLMPVSGLPMILPIFTYAFFHNKAGGFPKGGSLHIAKILQNEYERLDGHIHFNSPVKKVTFIDDIARGIVLENGTEIPSDIVVSCADGRLTLDSFLDGRYYTDKLKKYYTNGRPWDSVVYVSLGVDYDLSQTPKDVQYKLDTPVHINGKELRWSGFTHYSFDESFAPRGKSVIIVWMPGDYTYWKKLRSESREAYMNAKSAAIEFCTNELEKWFPGIKAKIEMTDVATPVTWHRYTNNDRGSIQGWAMDTKNFGTVFPRKLPGLGNFYMASQWTLLGGGVPSGMMQGKNTAQMIADDLNKGKIV